MASISHTGMMDSPFFGLYEGLCMLLLVLGGLQCPAYVDDAHKHDAYAK